REFGHRYPHAHDHMVHAEDVERFVEICRQPGKPVPFVPVIDADVRRWYKSDSLGYSHDDRFNADQVLCVPGPEAITGIRVADEPVGEILGSFARALDNAIPREVRPEARQAAESTPSAASEGANPAAVAESANTTRGALSLRLQEAE